MSSQWQRLAFILLISGLALPVAARLECRRSEMDLRYLRWRRDPQLVILAWSNVGEQAGATTDGQRMRLRALHRVRGHGQWLYLDGRRAAAESVPRETNSAGSDNYWNHLGQLVGGGSPFDVPVELRVTPPCLAAFDRDPIVAATKLGEKLAEALRERNGPLVTFEAGCTIQAAEALRAVFRSRGMGSAVGAVARPSAPFYAARLDYVVFDPMSFPSPWRDQAAMSYARAVAGEIPILVSVRRARFAPELFWLATGAAGVRYDFDAPVEDPAWSEELRWRRGVGAIYRLSDFQPLVWHPPAPTDTVLGRLTRAGWFELALVPNAPQMRCTVALPPAELDVTTFWYDAAADVFVVRPVLVGHRGPAVFDLAVPRPSRPYLFGIFAEPSRADRQTTYGEILPLEGELPEASDGETSAPSPVETATSH